MLLRVNRKKGNKALDKEFWQKRWRENRIAFHEPRVHDLLKLHFKSLGLRKGDAVFVPLCGKSLDIDWLLTAGVRVVGVEFNKAAIEEVFDRLDMTPTLTTKGKLVEYECDGLRIYEGDFFDLTTQQLGKIHAVYDRAALVALPADTRERYAARLSEITNCAPQLILSYSYDQSQTAGPPFSVPTAVLKKLYANAYNCLSIDSRLIEGPLATRCSGEENALLMIPKQIAINLVA